MQARDPNATALGNVMVEKSVRILIVDDDEVCREILRDAIQNDAVEVVLSGNGMEAVEMLAREPFDILLTDLNMPRMDGLGLLRHARQHHPGILTIIITGYGSMEAAIEAVQAGAYDYIQKPFKIGEIQVPVRNAVEKIMILRENARLSQELNTVHQKLQTLESGLDLDQGAPKSEVGALREAPGSAYFLFPSHSVPFSLFDAPQSDPDHILVFLERLKELRRSQVIDEEEFIRMKRMYLNKAETSVI